MTNEAMAQRVADQFARTAAKDPRVSAINRRMRKIKSEAVKYLNKVVDRHWDATDTFDYIGIGSTFRLRGYIAPGEYQGAVNIELDFVPGREHNGDEPGSVNVGLVAKDATGRQVAGYREKGTQTEDLARAMPKILAKAAKALAANLKGETDAEKAEMMSQVGEAIESAKTILGQLKELQKAIKASKNLQLDSGDLASLAHKIRTYEIEAPVRRIADLGTAMAKANR